MKTSKKRTKNVIRRGGKLPQDERKKYMDLCNQMTSRKHGLEYNHIADQMIEILKENTFAEINSLDDVEKKRQMLNDFTSIITNHQHDDANHIGRVNIFSLQVVILFTLNDVQYDSNFTNYDVVGRVKEDFRTLTEIDWKNYDAVKNFLITSTNPIRLTLLYNKDGMPRPDDFIYLITLIDYFTLHELITAFLDKNILCGVSYTSLFADGRWMNPYMFLDHDIIHGQNYKGFCFERLILDRNELKNFYEYCRTNYRTDNKIMYSIKVMIFLLIHEGLCDFFFEKRNSKLIEKREKFIENHFVGILKIERFTRPNDLDFVLSDELRDRLSVHRREEEKEEEAKKRGNLEEDVKKYLIGVIADYLNALDSWYVSKSGGGSKYKRKNRRTKRVSKRKRKNRKRSRRI